MNTQQLNHPSRQHFNLRSILSIAFISLLAIFFTTELFAGSIYWADPSYNKIQRADLDGTNIVDLIILPDQSTPHGIAIDVKGEKIYWSEPGVGSYKIRRADLDGTNIEDIAANVGSKSVALDLINGKIYWYDSLVESKFERADLDGSNIEDLTNFSQADRTGIAVDANGGKIYLTRNQLAAIERTDLNGLSHEVLIGSNLTDPREIDLDIFKGKMYWADALTGKVQRANLDGSNIEDIVTGLSNPHGIALDTYSGKVYWSDFGSKKIQKANLDGSYVEDVITELSLPLGIALRLDQSISIDVRPGSTENTVNLGAVGIIPVALLSSVDFNALSIDTETIWLSGATVRLAGKSDKYMCQSRDVNNDGLVDLVCDFETAAFLIEVGEDTVELTAETIDGIQVRGTDHIRIVP